MAVTLNDRRVDQALRTRLGGGLSAAICGEITAVLEQYVPHQTDLQQLTSQVDQAIFAALFRLLGKQLTYRHADGRVDTIQTDEIGSITDACMGVLLSTMHPTAANFALIKQYAMQTGSLAAFHLLADTYTAYLGEGELALIRRILGERQ